MAIASEPALHPASQPNSLAAITARRTSGQISWTGPLLLLLARSAMWMTAQGLVALLFVLQQRPNPWRQACYWWSVCYTLADAVCLIAMRFFLKREGLRLRDLLGPVRLRWGHDIFLGIGYFLLFSPGFFIGGFLSQRLFYGTSGVNPSNFILSSHALPLWAVGYSITLFWLINSVVEEATYQGYVLPRLQALTGHTWIAFSAVVFFFSLQHCAIGFVPDWRSVACRFFGFVPGVAVVVAIYMRTRRLTPLIVGHWIIDIAAVLMCNVF